MKRLVAGLTIFGFLIFLNRPLFSGPLDSSQVPSQPETSVSNVVSPPTPGEKTYIDDLGQSIRDAIDAENSKNSNDPSEQPEITYNWGNEADDGEIEMKAPVNENPTYNIEPKDRDNSAPPPLRSVVEDLFEFVGREEESIRKIDLVDGEFSMSALDSAAMRQLELKLMKYIDAALFTIEQGEITAMDVIVLDAVEFTAQIRAIHKLLNPPARLDPLLKWLLYLNRITPEMIELYQAALEKRDRIFLLAARSNGKLKIRYNGKILNDVVYVWPDQEVRYELVIAPPAAASSTQQPLS